MDQERKFNDRSQVFIPKKRLDIIYCAL